MHKYLTIIFVALLIIDLGLSPDPVSSQNPAPKPMVTLTPEEKAWLDTQPTIKVRMSNLPPFILKDQGKPAGFSVELLERIADLIGFDVEYIFGVSWPEGLEHIKRQDGKVDLILAAMNTPERREFMLFSKSYIEQPYMIYTRQDNDMIHNIDDLIGKTVAIEEKQALVEVIRRSYPGIRLMKVKGYAPEALRTVSSGDADAYIGIMSVANYHIGKLGLIHLKSVATAPVGFHTHGFGVRKDWPELQSIINKGLAAIPLGERLEMLERWGASGAAKVKTPSIADTETLPLLTLEFPPWNYQEKESRRIVGSSVEIIQEIFHRTGYKTKIDIKPWKRGQQEVAEGKYAGVFTLTKSPTRLKYFYYTEPISTLTEVFFKRKDRNITWDKLEDLKGLRVGVVDGYNYSDAFKGALRSELFNIYEVASFDPDYLNLQKLSSGRIDLFISFVNLGSHIIKENPDTLSTIDYIDKPIGKPRLFYFAFSKKWPKALELRDRFNDELKKYAMEGRLDAIHNEHGMPLFFEESVDGTVEGFQDHYSRVRGRGDDQPKVVEAIRDRLTDTEPAVTLTPDEKAWLEAHPDIQLGFTGDFEPHVIINPDGSYRGLLVDFLDELNKRLGTRIALRTDSVPRILEKAKTKQVDGILFLHPERAENLGLLKTRGYLAVYPTVFARRNVSFEHPADFAGKKVAIIDEVYFSQEIIQQYQDQTTVVIAKDALDGLRKVDMGEADLFLGASVHSYLLTKYQFFGISPKYGFLKYKQKFGMAIRPDWPELIPVINKGISSFTENEIDAIVSKWIQLPQKKGALALTAEERAWLDQKHTVRVRVADWPPYLIIRDNQPPQGIVIEYLKLIGEQTGIKFKYEVTDEPFAKFLDRMKQRQGPDMTAVIVPTPEREQYLSFSETYIASPYVIFTREQDNPILDISGLTGKTLAVPRSFVVQQQLDKNYPEIRQALYDSDEAALQAVATGQADAFIGNLTVASHIIHGRGFSHLRVAAGSPFGDQSLSMGNRNDWPELTSIINKALASITEEEKTAIRSKYLAIKFEQGINKAEVLKWTIIIGGSAAGIILLFIFWNTRLSKEISKRKQIENDLKLAKDTAEAANESKSIFLANMSHELRTPLNAILGFSGLLTRGGNIAPDQREKLSIINRSGQHLLSMINDVLDLSKIEAERIELQETPFDLVVLIKEISMMIHSRATEKGISMAVEAESNSVPYIKADAGKLRQILINLLNNAVKFTDEGGVTIRCTTELIPEKPNRCRIVIEVEDTGQGIDQARQAKIFDPFVQEHDAPERKGTGLGLSICKKYADFMGGTIEVESEVGKGSIFRLRLPAEIAEAADLRTPVDGQLRVIGLAPAEKIWRILIADDNPENLLLLKSLLEEVGFFVFGAENGKEAVAAFRKESPDFVWMDMRMPVMNGYEAVRQIRQCSGGDTVPIIAITASAFGEQRNEILASGCNDMVIKPFQKHEIFEMMGRFLDLEYIYEPESEATPDRIDEVALTSDMLAGLPEDLLQDLKKHSLSADREAISEVIDRIKPLAPDMAKGLQMLLGNFQIARIHDLLEEVKDEEME